MTTISIPLAIWGSGYSELLPKWWEGIESLERQPEEIVIVTDSANHEAVNKYIPDSNRIKILELELADYAEYWNTAIDFCSSEWFAICNADDVFLPEALNQIDEADVQGCNLLCDRIRDKHNGNTHNSRWIPKTIATNWSLVGAEPMKKALFIEAGGFRSGYRFADWALAMDMAKLGKVKAFDAKTIRITYDRGLDRQTLSGVLVSQEERNKGNRMLRELAEKLGL